MRRVLTVLLVVFGAAALIAACVGVFYIYQITRDLPGVDALKNYNPPVTTRVYAGDGTILGEYARERRIFVPVEFVPKLVVEAFLSAEDKNFFRHPGIDPMGIARAAVKDVFNIVRGKRLEGASTITQQVAKNFLLTNQRKFSRKLREAILAIRIDSTYSKDKILELYLNEIYLGQNSYGIGAATLNYFGKSLDQLSIAEVAFLAALPKAPSNYDPRFRKAAAVGRRNWVIEQMRENGYITREQAAQAKAEDLVTGSRALGSQTEDADYFVEDVRRKLYAKYGADKLYDGGLQVRSTLDTRLQNLAVNALRMGLVRYDHRHGWRGTKNSIDITGDWKSALSAIKNTSGIDTWRVAVVLGFDKAKTTDIGFTDGSHGKIPLASLAWARKPNPDASVGPSPTSPAEVYKPGNVIYVEKTEGKDNYGLRQIPKVNGAIVVMDPHTGRVLAMSGGFSYPSSEFNRASQAMRQPGSAFKPFVYATALENGYTPVSKILDAPVEMYQGPGLPMWRPENYEKSFIGLATLRRGIELSRNLMTIRLADAVGMKKIAGLVERFGVYDHLAPNLANSIGAAETTLLRVVTGYSEFANGGKKVTPTLVDRIQDRNGKTIYRHDTRVCSDCNATWHNQSDPLIPDNRPQVMDARIAFQTVSLMEGVVLRGTARSVSVIGKPLAGKTGTSNDSKDVWFVGFSPDLVAGVFVGFDDPKTLGKREQGATVAAPIFRDFMKEALAGVPPIPFRVPAGIVFVPVDRMSGAEVAAGTPGSIEEAFRAGTEPGVAGMDEQPVTPMNTQGQTTFGPATTVGEGTGGLY